MSWLTSNKPWNSLGKFMKSEAGTYAMGGAMIGGTYGYGSDRDIYGPAMLGAGLGYGAYRFNASGGLTNARNRFSKAAALGKPFYSSVSGPAAMGTLPITKAVPAQSLVNTLSSVLQGKTKNLLNDNPYRVNSLIPGMSVSANRFAGMIPGSMQGARVGVQEMGIMRNNYLKSSVNFNRGVEAAFNVGENMFSEIVGGGMKMGGFGRILQSSRRVGSSALAILRGGRARGIFSSLSRLI